MIGIKQLASVVNYIIQLIFVSLVEYSYEKYIMMLIKSQLMAKNRGRYTLFLHKLLAHNS